MTKKRITILSLILLGGLLFPLVGKICADPFGMIIRPSKSDKVQKAEITPPEKSGYFENTIKQEVIIYEPEPSKSGRLEFELKDKSEKLIIPQISQEEIHSLPEISLPRRTGYFSANKPRSLSKKEKIKVQKYSPNPSYNYYTDHLESFYQQANHTTKANTDRNKSSNRQNSIWTPVPGFSEVDNTPVDFPSSNEKSKQIESRKTGVKLLPQIEIPVDRSPQPAPQWPKKKVFKQITPLLNQKPVKKSIQQSETIQKTSYKKTEVKKAIQTSKINAILTGIESEKDEQDFFDKEYLRESAGLEKINQKELEEIELPPLEEELSNHGGSHLYVPEGDEYQVRKQECQPEDQFSFAHSKPLRLPEHWQKPKPITGFQEFLGADFIKPYPGLKWFGDEGYQWEPRFTAYGSYELFGMHFEEGNREQIGIGHQLLVDLDLRITGTERAHVQFRPLGRKNSGGSFYQFNSPSGYDDNSTLIPDRYWVEGEFRSIMNGLINDSFTPLDYHFVAGKFPFALHNNILISDDVHGLVINKNTLLIPPFSNMNIQFFYLLDDVDTILGPTAEVAGTHVTADYRHSLLEGTFAYVDPSGPVNDETYYFAGAWTQFIGQLSLTGRVLAKTGESAVFDDAVLYVLESNYHTPVPESIKHCTGFDHAVLYSTAFHATEGWVPISGGNFDRLRSTFEVDPLISISRGRVNDDTTGVAVGYQLFANEDDESLIPEVAYENPGNDEMYGVSLRYLYKLNPRTFLDCRTIQTWSSNSQLERKGAFVSTTVIF